MKRTTSTLAALGLALTGTVAFAGAFIPQGGRVERQPSDNPEAAPGPVAGGSDRGRDGRGGGMRDERRAEPPRPEPPRVEPPRVEPPRVEPRDARRDERREDRRDERRDDRRDDRREDRRDMGADARRWDDRRGDDRGRGSPPPRDSRGYDDRRVYREPPRPGWSTRPYDRDRGQSYGWRDDRGRDWRYRREWYDQYRADRWRYDRGRWLARERFSIGIYIAPRGYALRSWQRGQWLPSVYYVERRWQLDDYWRYDLYDPPYAAGWVRVGYDAVLVDLRSGEVLDVVCELFW